MESNLSSRRAGVDLERRLATQHAAVSALAESTTLAEAVPRLLEAVGRGLGWDYGALWMPTATGGDATLRCTQTWFGPGVAAGEFDALSREKPLAPGTGLPGRVWESAAPSWLTDVTVDENFVRAPAAERAGLRTAFAFPVIRGDAEVLAVLEFLSHERREVDDAVLADFAVFGFQMGLFIQRETAEREVRHSRDQLEAILRSVPAGIMVLDGRGAVAFANDKAAELAGYASTNDLLAAGPGQPLPSGWETYDEHGQPTPGVELPGTKALRGIESAAVVLKVAPRDRGRERWVMARATPVPDGQGGFLAVCVFEEISKIKRTEQALRRSETRHRSISQTLQTALAPPEPPRVSGLEIAVRFRAQGPESEIGGDFYDIFRTSERRWGVLIGDVAGKGIDAAATAALARHTVRAAALHDDDPSSVLGMLNQAVERQPSTRRFCTAVYATLDLGELWVRAQIASAGHPLPFLLRSHGGAEHVGGRGPLLAGFEEARYAAEPAHLAPGDALVLYTDGVIEAGERGEADDPALEPSRLATLLGACVGLDAEGIADRIVDAMLAAEGGDARDDAAIFVLRLPQEGGRA